MDFLTTSTSQTLRKCLYYGPNAVAYCMHTESPLEYILSGLYIALLTSLKVCTFSISSLPHHIRSIHRESTIHSHRALVDCTAILPSPGVWVYYISSMHASNQKSTLRIQSTLAQGFRRLHTVLAILAQGPYLQHTSSLHAANQSSTSCIQSTLDYGFGLCLQHNPYLVSPR